SPDGKFALTAAGGGKPGVPGLLDLDVVLWDLEKSKIVHRFREPRFLVQSLAFTQDGKYAVGGGMDVPVRIWNLQPRKQVRTIANAESNEGMVELVPAGGSRILVGRGNGKIRLVDCSTNADPRPFTGKQPGGVQGMAVSADGKTLLTVGVELEFQSGA